VVEPPSRRDMARPIVDWRPKDSPPIVEDRPSWGRGPDGEPAPSRLRRASAGWRTPAASVPGTPLSVVRLLPSRRLSMRKNACGASGELPGRSSGSGSGPASDAEGLLKALSSTCWWLTVACSVSLRASVGDAVELLMEPSPPRGAVGLSGWPLPAGASPCAAGQVNAFIGKASAGVVGNALLLSARMGLCTWQHG
jgi:hypothetical protein